MIPEFGEDGNLPPGIHWASWAELARKFGTTPWRRELLRGLREAVDSLNAAGCQTIYVDGSFVTSKETPGDFDACWDSVGVDPTILDPSLLIFRSQRAAQKAKFRGELFPSSMQARGFSISFKSTRKQGNPREPLASTSGGFDDQK